MHSLYGLRDMTWSAWSRSCGTICARHPSGVTILCAGMQLIQGKLADMYTVTAATRAFVYKTAAEADAGRADRKDCAAVILYAAEHATRMALDAIQVSNAGPHAPQADMQGEGAADAHNDATHCERLILAFLQSLCCLLPDAWCCRLALAHPMVGR